MIRDIKFTIEKIDEPHSETESAASADLPKESTEQKTDREALIALRSMITAQANSFRKLS